MSITQTTTQKPVPIEKVQFSARIRPENKRAFKAEAVRGEGLTIELMTEVLILRFFADNPTPEERDQFWRANRGMVEAARQ